MKFIENTSKMLIRRSLEKIINKELADENYIKDIERLCIEHRNSICCIFFEYHLNLLGLGKESYANKSKSTNKRHAFVHAFFLNLAREDMELVINIFLRKESFALEFIPRLRYYINIEKCSYKDAYYHTFKNINSANKDINIARVVSLAYTVEAWQYILLNHLDELELGLVDKDTLLKLTGELNKLIEISNVLKERSIEYYAK